MGGEGVTCWTGDAIQMVVRTPALVELYWSRVGRDPALTCWPWVGALSDHGHGRFWVAGRCVGAHRIGWALAHPDTPLPEMVTHDCDTPSCQNPAHLRAGNVTSNNAEYRARAGMPGSPLNDRRGARRRAVALREAILDGGDVRQAAQEGMSDLDRFQPPLF